MAVYRVLNEILSCYSVVLAVLGTIGNLLAAGLCLRKKLRRIPTFVFYAVLSLNNIMILYHWNINNFFQTYFGFFIPDISIVTCRLTSFLQMGFSQASSYLMIALALERYISVKIKNWRTFYFNSKKALTTSLIIIVFFMLFDSHLLLTLPFVRVENATNICFSSKMYSTWREIHTYLYSIVPFVLLAIINSLLIYEVVQSKKKTLSKELKEAKSLSVSVIMFTLLFIVMTGPFAFIGGYFISFLKTESGRVIIFTGVVLAHTFHGSNFVLWFFLNKKFKQEFKHLLTEMKNFTKNQVGILASYTNNSSSAQNVNTNSSNTR